MPCLVLPHGVQCLQEDWRSQEKTEATEQHLCKNWTMIWFPNQSRIACSPMIGILEGFLFVQGLVFHTAGQLDFRRDDTKYSLLSF